MPSIRTCIHSPSQIEIKTLRPKSDSGQISSSPTCSCFKKLPSSFVMLTLLLVQPCGELDLEKKCALVSGYMPKISAAILDEAAGKLTGKGT
uniref:uncharacterized protein LOC101303148 isoform X4 n=1 Tax=Fragaria vesca subsp. vesca TaxID=101020 RepID=UPI0005CAA1A9|nr:PREDICTED: uncharacterized protein LOC101303148 isoform X4 [Fragaria vesca subsp. vesca]